MNAFIILITVLFSHTTLGQGGGQYQAGGSFGKGGNYYDYDENGDPIPPTKKVKGWYYGGQYLDKDGKPFTPKHDRFGINGRYLVDKNGKPISLRQAQLKGGGYFVDKDDKPPLPNQVKSQGGGDFVDKNGNPVSITEIKSRKDGGFFFYKDGKPISNSEAKKIIFKQNQNLHKCRMKDDGKVECRKRKDWWKKAERTSGISGCEGGTMSPDSKTITCPNGNVYRLDKGSVFDSIMRWAKPKSEKNDNNPTGLGQGGRNR